MGLKIKRKKGTFLPPMEAGTYPAVCVGVVDLGEQYGETFKKYADKVLLIWEIPSQTVTVDGEEKPRCLSNEFTASLDEKSTLYKFLVPWRGKPFSEEELKEDGDGFDVKSMLGSGCFLQVIVGEKDDGRKFNKITTAIAPPAGMDAPQAASELLSFDIDAWDDSALVKLPEWVQEKIKKSTQYQKEHMPVDAISMDSKGSAQSPAPSTPAQAAAPSGGGCPI